MKKFLTIVAIAALTVGLAACSKADKAETAENASENLENTVSDAAADVAANVTDIAESTNTAMGEAAEEASDALAAKIDEGNNKIREAADKVSNKVSETAGKVADKADEVAQRITNPVKYTPETIRPNSKVDRVTVIDFNATWCVPCKALTPVFKAAEKTFAGKIDFLEIDIDKYSETATAFGVQSIPTVVVMRPDGKTKTYVGTGELLPADKFNKILTDALK